MLPLLAFSCACANSFFYSCTSTNLNTVRITSSYEEPADAWVEFIDSYSEIGWGKVYVWTNGSRPSYNQMFCAGYADGYATAARIREAFDNYNESLLLNETTGQYNEPGWPSSWRDWFTANIAYVRNQSKLPDPYWVRTGLILAQFDGLLAGNNARAAELGLPLLSELDLWILQSAGDIGDLEEILESSVPKREPELKLHCTALIKLAPGNSDIYFAHTTWSDVRDLHAYLKEYNLNVPEFTSRRVSISTRTGLIGSVDDFWTNDRGLLVFETTINNFNKTLYELYTKSESVLTWMRSYHTMWASDAGEPWTQHFARENSGTYNNEYIILDTKKWTAGQPPPPGLIWMIEQMPGFTKSADMTGLFTNKTYIEGINAPQFREIWDIADYTGEQKRDPDKAGFWSFDDQIREYLIVRDAPNLSSYAAFQEFMQYNDYLHDPLMKIPETGEREPAQGILARYDLRPENGTAWGARRHFGGLDVKTVSVKAWLAGHAWDARLGMPQNLTRGIPPFNFSDWPAIHHHGLPDVGVYDWTSFPPGDKCAAVVAKGDDAKCAKVSGCGFCVSTQQCLTGSADGPDEYIGQTCEVGWEFPQELGAWVIPVIAAVSALVFLFVVVTFGIHFFRVYRRHSQVDYDFHRL
jgi:hypothetical protein